MNEMLLRSCIHRVVPSALEGEWDWGQASFSLAFFNQLELESAFRDGAGRVL